MKKTILSNKILDKSTWLTLKQYLKNLNKPYKPTFNNKKYDWNKIQTTSRNSIWV